MLVSAAALLLFTATCQNAAGSDDSLEVTGTIEQQGMTSYQYGSHTLTGEGDIYYALTSEAVDLDNYLGEEVTIRAEKVEGYPVDGGPDYLRVLEVLK